MKFFVADFVVSFVLTAVFLKLLINRARKGQMTQTIREDGPQAHFAKSGTPTMGGVAIFLSIVASAFVAKIILERIWNIESHIFRFIDNYDSWWLPYKFLCMTSLFLLFFCMGFIDDFLNLRKSRYLGLRPIYKFLLQFIFSFLWLVMYRLPWQVSEIVFVLIVIVGTVNAVNITDGLDGLASGIISLCLIPFLFYAISQRDWAATLFILMILGCTTAFLWFNVHPAKIFMGNCGSMGLGAALAAVAIVLHKEFMLLICGAVFVVETLSVILQVAYFKSTKKRIFKMAPIHHHFELSGYKETQITRGLWFAGLASCVTGALVFKILEFGL